MKTILAKVVVLFALLLGCNGTSEALNEAETVTFTIYHSNDLVGYLKPCG